MYPKLPISKETFWQVRFLLTEDSQSFEQQEFPSEQELGFD
jgi:hypothetical protein